MKARWWQQEDGRFRCGLCFRACLLSEGQLGFCGARGVEGGAFISPWLGRFSSLAVDPIEKKPLHHWRPGSSILSLGSLGCTMACPFCQNHGIAHPEGQVPVKEISPARLAAQARELGLKAVAYTYNEPGLQAEYILEAAPRLNEAGAATVLVSNAMTASEVTRELAAVVSAANIDLKSFNPETYSRLGGSLETVLGNIKLMLEDGVHIELTTLVVPGISDHPGEFEELVDWTASLSPDIPLHISRYFPAYKYSAPTTDLDLLKRFESTAKARLKHVHLGNVR